MINDNILNIGHWMLLNGSTKVGESSKTLANNLVKRVAVVLVFSFVAGFLSAQSTTPVCGGSDKNFRTGSMSYTVGQVDYQLSQSKTNIAIAGVQQPFDENIAYNTTCDGIELMLYPNPITENAYVVCDALDASYAYTVTDMTAKLFIEGHLEGEYTTIPMTQLTPGAYLLKIVCGEGEEDFTVFKIFKN